MAKKDALPAVAGFSLKKQACKISHLNVREEKHGDTPVLAIDVKVVADVPNKLLDQLSPGLRSSVYAKASAPAEEQLVDGDDHLTVLRFPQLADLEWDASLVDCRFIVHGAKKEDDLEFEADVDTLGMSCKEGGTVELTFKAKVHPTPEQSGVLTGFLGLKSKISVVPVAQPELPPVEA